MLTPFQYRAWVKKMDWAKGELVADDPSVIYDGDSGYLFSDLGRKQYDNNRFRLFGVNAPEVNSSDPAVRARAVAARDWLRQQVLGKQVFIVSKAYEDKYGRILVLIWTNEADVPDATKSVNAQMLNLKLAEPYMGELV